MAKITKDYYWKIWKIQNKFSWYIDRFVAPIDKHYQVLLTPLTTLRSTSMVNSHKNKSFRSWNSGLRVAFCWEVYLDSEAAWQNEMDREVINLINSLHQRENDFFRVFGNL